MCAGVVRCRQGHRVASQVVGQKLPDRARAPCAVVGHRAGVAARRPHRHRRGVAQIYIQRLYCGLVSPMETVRRRSHAGRLQGHRGAVEDYVVHLRQRVHRDSLGGAVEVIGVGAIGL